MESWKFLEIFEMSVCHLSWSDVFYVVSDGNSTAVLFGEEWGKVLTNISSTQNSWVNALPHAGIS